MAPRSADGPGALSTVFVLAVVGVVLVSFTVVGLPVAVWLFVRWLFLPQAVMLEHRGGRAGSAHSARLVRRRWWHTALVATVTLGIVSAFGLVVGLVLLLAFTGLPLWALSAIVAMCNILATPYGAVAMTYMYGNAVSADTTDVDPDPDPAATRDLARGDVSAPGHTSRSTRTAGGRRRRSHEPPLERPPRNARIRTFETGFTMVERGIGPTAICRD